MTEQPPPPQWKIGDIANGHILVATGWVPLRPQVTDAPPHHPGDVVNGHAFTGEVWVPVQSATAAPAYTSHAPTNFAQSRNVHTFGESKPNWFMRLPQKQRWLLGGGAAAVIGALVIADQIFQTKPAGLDKQEDFRIIVSNYQYMNVDNDTQVVEAKRDRGSEICSVLPTDLSFEGWTGTVSSVTTELGGDEGLVKINLFKSVDVVGEDIDPDSEVFGQLAALEDGQSVAISGTFEDDDDYCIEELSLGSRNGLKTPDFKVNLSSIG